MRITESLLTLHWLSTIKSWQQRGSHLIRWVILNILRICLLKDPQCPSYQRLLLLPRQNLPPRWGAIGIIKVEMYRSLPFTQSQPNFVLLLQWPSDVSDELFGFPTAKVCTCHIDSSNWMIFSLPFSPLLHLHMPQKGIVICIWESAKPSSRGVIITPVIMIFRRISDELRFSDYIHCLASD